VHSQNKIPYCRHWSVLPLVSYAGVSESVARPTRLVVWCDGDVDYRGSSAEGTYSIVWDWNHDWDLVSPHSNKD